VASLVFLTGGRKDESSRQNGASQPRPPLGTANQGRVPSISATIRQDKVYCRKYPDVISPDMSKIRTLDSGTDVEITCWTFSELPDSTGRVGGDGMWLKTNLDCYINEINIEEQQNFGATLRRCAPTSHWVGTLQQQYQRKDCYSCPSLNCASKNLGSPPYVDLACSTQGDLVNGNPVWLQSKDDKCYLPEAVFDSKGFLGGNQGPCQPQSQSWSTAISPIR